MKRMVRLTVFLVLVSLVFFAGGNQAIIDASASSKILRLITWSGYAPAELIAKFKAETGIEVEVILSSNEEMISKLRATRGGGFDLAQPTSDRISSVVAEYGLYQPIDYSKIDLDQLDPSLVAAVKKSTLVDGKYYGVSAVYGTDGLVVNFEKAPNVKDYKDLLDPKYTGRVSYRLKRPTLCSMGFSFGYDPFELYNDLEGYQKFLEDISEKLIAAKPVVRFYWDNGDQLLESIRSGEVWVAQAWEQAGWKLHEENPNIDYIAPTSGAMAWIDTFAIPAKSENVEGAYKWINFFLRPENAAVFTNAEKYGTASKDAGKYLNPDIAANFARCLPPEALANANVYPTIPVGLEEMEGKYLDKIKAAK
ncbi:spermidine/putrescine ABC transporter substrate-binding protein [Candidatus Atribacteria bacterium HGW-Atribacteria-1]|nr:MAG: spermidine/putrescine ABC transporter substrate-binding protein [Candidatus Atribacteria bacterium HGW-Atribacteria-1]